MDPIRDDDDDDDDDDDEEDDDDDDNEYPNPMLTKTITFMRYDKRKWIAASTTTTTTTTMTSTTMMMIRVVARINCNKCLSSASLEIVAHLAAKPNE